MRAFHGFRVGLSTAVELFRAVLRSPWWWTAPLLVVLLFLALLFVLLQVVPLAAPFVYTLF